MLDSTYNITYKTLLTEEELENLSQLVPSDDESISDGYISWISEKGRKLVIAGTSNTRLKIIGFSNDAISGENSDRQEYFRKLIRNIHNPLEKKIFKRLFSERDITPELSNSNHIKIEGSGAGITNTVESYINSSKLSEKSDEIIKNRFLPALNDVFSQNSLFTGITCRRTF